MSHLSSMTAFAQASAVRGGYLISWELRSVNHRYLESQFRLPDTLRALEFSVRDLLRKRVKRGKVDLTLKLEPEASEQALALNSELLGQLVAAAREVHLVVPEATPPTTLDLLRWPGVLESNQVDQDGIMQAATDVFMQALERLGEARASEGQRLETVIQQQLATIDALVESVRPFADNVIHMQQQRLEQRLQDLQTQADPARLEQEVALLAQRGDVREELDRLVIHVAEARKLIGKPGPHGRRLDFLSQELNREANTLGAKATHTDMSQKAIDLKVVIEQIREQVQNIE